MSLFSLLSAVCFGQNVDTAPILEKVEADMPVYAHLLAKLIDRYTKMDEVMDCDIQVQESTSTGALEKVSIFLRVDPELLKKRRKLYESKAHAAILLLSSKAKRKVRNALAQEIDIEKMIPAYKKMIYKTLSVAFPELRPEDIVIDITLK